MEQFREKKSQLRGPMAQITLNCLRSDWQAPQCIYQKTGRRCLVRGDLTSLRWTWIISYGATEQLDIGIFFHVWWEILVRE